MQSVYIALCFNNNYCQLAAGALQSIINHATPKFEYHIYIIQSDITEQNQYILSKINNKNNVYIKFMCFDVQTMASHSLYVGKYFSRDMYTRLFLHKLFPNIDKMLYTDVDIIVNSDIAHLYNIDLQGHPIAAPLHRYAQAGEIEKFKTATWIKNSKEEKFRKYENVYNYLVEYLGFSHEDIRSYFTSGTLLFDLKKSGRILDDGLPKLIKNEYIFPDLDILNLLFKNNILVLDKGYCVYPVDLLSYINEHGRLPQIIHYAGIAKPNRIMSRLADTEYWKALSQTDLYYPVLDDFINDKVSKALNRSYFDNLGRLYIDLKRINRLKRRQWLVRAVIKLVVSKKKYKKLKKTPERFFEDSKSGFIRYLKKFYF